MTDCVLCDWKFDPFAPAVFVYRGSEPMPLVWDTDGPREVRPSEAMGETIKGVATVAHWADAHTEQLCAAIDAGIQLDSFPRNKISGSMAVAPPVTPPPASSMTIEMVIDPEIFKLLMGFDLPDEDDEPLC